MLHRLSVAIVIGLSLLAISGCSERGSIPSAPSPASSFNLSGAVLETTPAGSRPAGSLPLWVRVQTTTSWGHFGSTSSDEQGRYSVSNLPRGTVFLEAAWSSYRQPCFASIELRSDAVLDVEVISEATLLSSGPSSLRTISGRMVSGVVFERTPNGDRPVAGASLQAWVGDWLYGASTSTDTSGRYLLCRVPRDLPVSLYTDKAGYAQHTSEVSPGGDTIVDIQLEPR